MVCPPTEARPRRKLPQATQQLEWTSDPQTFCVKRPHAIERASKQTRDNDQLDATGQRNGTLQTGEKHHRHLHKRGGVYSSSASASSEASPMPAKSR